MIKCIIFDLDDTLCDYSSARDNAKILVNQALLKENISTKEFWNTYSQTEPILFRRFVNNDISKEEYRMRRFADLLVERHSSPFELSTKLNNIYMDEANLNVKCFSDVKIVLKKIMERNMLATILTNGPSDGQRNKLKVLNLEQYIQKVYISEEINYSKPNPRAFKHVLKDLNLKPKETLMVGDSLEDDVRAANKVGIKSILIDRQNRQKDYLGIKITNLSQIFNYIR